MYQLTSVFFLYRAQCFVFLISDALLDWIPSQDFDLKFSNTVIFMVCSNIILYLITF